MNPDHMKKQENPDGKSGHIEREKIYKDVKRVSDNTISQTPSRLDNVYMDNGGSLSDLQKEIRMKQCKARVAECYQKDIQECMCCGEYNV
jgi:hypothetical protein